MIFQVLCCFLLLLLLFCHMALEVCFHIFGIKRLDNTYVIVVDVDYLIPLAVRRICFSLDSGYMITNRTGQNRDKKGVFINFFKIFLHTKRAAKRLP